MQGDTSTGIYKWLFCIVSNFAIKNNYLIRPTGNSDKTIPLRSSSFLTNCVVH